MKIIIVMAIVAALAGCATSSGIVPTGKGTYVLATPGAMGYAWEDSQKAETLKQASDYCKNIGKELLPINAAEAHGGSGRIAADGVEFTCK